MAKFGLEYDLRNSEHDNKFADFRLIFFADFLSETCNKRWKYTENIFLNQLDRFIAKLIRSRLDNLFMGSLLVRSSTLKFNLNSKYGSGVK